MTLRPSDWNAQDERDAEREWVAGQEARLVELEVIIPRLEGEMAPGYWVLANRLADLRRERNRIEDELMYNAEYHSTATERRLGLL